jgi:hypothetical protein
MQPSVHLSLNLSQPVLRNPSVFAIQYPNETFSLRFVVHREPPFAYRSASTSEPATDTLRQTDLVGGYHEHRPDETTSGPISDHAANQAAFPAGCGASSWATS